MSNEAFPVMSVSFIPSLLDSFWRLGTLHGHFHTFSTFYSGYIKKGKTLEDYLNDLSQNVNVGTAVCAKRI